MSKNPGDSTQRISMVEEMAAINKGKRGWNQVQRDSTAKTFPRKEWEGTVAASGYKSVGPVSKARRDKK